MRDAGDREWGEERGKTEEWQAAQVSGANGFVAR
jgi:hypothetical protein